MLLSIWQTRQDTTCGGPALRSNLTGFGPPGEDICDWGEATWQVLNIFLVSFQKSGCVVGSQVVFSEVRLFSTSSPPSSRLPSASGWWSPTSGFWQFKEILTTSIQSSLILLEQHLDFRFWRPGVCAERLLRRADYWAADREGAARAVGCRSCGCGGSFYNLFRRRTWYGILVFTSAIQQGALQLRTLPKRGSHPGTWYTL